MILLSGTTLQKNHVVAIFGLGLIGNAILRALHRQSRFEAEHWPFRWTPSADTRIDCAAVETRLRDLVHGWPNNGNPGRLTFVWSAGRAGFAASDDEVAAELECFSVVVDLAHSLLATEQELQYSFHLVSSLGGLYEGVTNVAASQPVAPPRPYGQLKLRQEMLAAERLGTDRVQVYRPSSVYDFPGTGFRMGLIPTLIRNGLCNRVSRIVGGMSTLRDYVLASDVGEFIAAGILADRPRPAPTAHLLASGKPSTIFEVQQAVEERLGRRIYISFDNDPRRDNSSNITVSRAALPQDWFPSDLRTGVGLVTERMYRRRAITGGH